MLTGLSLMPQPGSAHGAQTCVRCAIAGDCPSRRERAGDSRVFDGLRHTIPTCSRVVSLAGMARGRRWASASIGQSHVANSSRGQDAIPSLRAVPRAKILRSPGAG